jgi:hypothetical protein
MVYIQSTDGHAINPKKKKSLLYRAYGADPGMIIGKTRWFMNIHYNKNPDCFMSGFIIGSGY